MTTQDKIKEVEKELMNRGGILIGKDYPICKLLEITNERDMFRVSFILVYREEKYGRGYSKRLFIQRRECKYPYTCSTIVGEIQV